MSKSLFLNLEEVDELSIEQLYNDIENSLEDKESNPLISPESHNEARNWVFAYQKLEAEKERLEKEYIPFLIDRYIKPIKEKIQKHNNAQEIIKNGIYEFLENIEETKAIFPDLATVYIQKSTEKIIYPENEEEIAMSIKETNPEFVKTYVKLDKNSIKKSWSKTGELPHPSIVVESTGPSIRFRKAKIDA